MFTLCRTVQIKWPIQIKIKYALFVTSINHVKNVSEARSFNERRFAWWGRTMHLGLTVPWNKREIWNQHVLSILRQCLGLILWALPTSGQQGLCWRDWLNDLCSLGLPSSIALTFQDPPHRPGHQWPSPACWLLPWSRKMQVLPPRCPPHASGQRQPHDSQHSHSQKGAKADYRLSSGNNQD